MDKFEDRRKKGPFNRIIAFAGAGVAVVVVGILVANPSIDYLPNHMPIQSDKPFRERSDNIVEGQNASSNILTDNQYNSSKLETNQTAEVKVPIDLVQTQKQVLSSAASIDSKLFQLSKTMKTIQSQVENQDYDLAYSELMKADNLTSTIASSQQDIANTYQELMAPNGALSSNGSQIDIQDQNDTKKILLTSLLFARSDLNLYQRLDQVDNKLADLLLAQQSILLLDLSTSPAPPSETYKWRSLKDDSQKTLDTAFGILNESKKEEPLSPSASDQIMLNSSGTFSHLETIRKSSIAKLEMVLTIGRDIVYSLDEQQLKFSSHQPELNALRNYTLSLINQDRKLSNLNSVNLSSNLAAQIQAQDILKSGKISHWMTTGEKPYMVYTRFGGLGYVDQNVAVGGYSQYRECITSTNTLGECKKIEPDKSIDALEDEMMYNDLKCCDDGHRRNILDNFHTDVSIGIAYNDYFLVLVENFENNYISASAHPVEFDNQKNTVTVSGSLLQGKPLSATVQFDELPTPYVYESNKDRNSYDLGSVLAAVYDSQEFKYRNQSSTSKAIEASDWQVNPDGFNIKFEISSLISHLPSAKENAHSGVLTIVLWLYGKDGDSTEFPVTSYSIVI